MERFPLGIATLDTIIGGGVPTGSTILLAGETGAGAREFIHTSAIMNGLLQSDSDLFELYYGELAENTDTPPEIHYVSFNEGENTLEKEMLYTMDTDIVEEGIENIRVADFSDEYFDLSPVPEEWYLETPNDIHSLGNDGQGTESVVKAFGKYLSEHGHGNIVFVDSITDLVTSMDDTLGWAELTVMVKGMQKAAHKWNSVIVMLLNRKALSESEFGQLSDSTDGTFMFEWESGGNQRTRTMYVKQFRGILSRLEDEDIIQFETEIGEDGFDISDVRKIK